MSGHIDLEELARIVIDCGFRLHCDLGPGLLESAYEALIAAVLERRGIKVARQVSMPLRHDDIVIDNAFKIDPFDRESLDCRTEVDRATRAGAWETGFDLSAPSEFAARPAHEFWASHFQGRPAAHRQ